MNIERYHANRGRMTTTNGKAPPPSVLRFMGLFFKRVLHTQRGIRDRIIKSTSTGQICGSHKKKRVAVSHMSIWPQLVVRRIALCKQVDAVAVVATFTSPPFTYLKKSNRHTHAPKYIHIEESTTPGNLRTAACTITTNEDHIEHPR
jgi:hypothetical protein